MLRVTRVRTIHFAREKPRFQPGSPCNKFAPYKVGESSRRGIAHPNWVGKPKVRPICGGKKQGLMKSPCRETPRKN